MTSPAAPTPVALDVSRRRLLATAWPLALHGLVTVAVAANDVVLLGGEGAAVVASGAVAAAVLTTLVVAVVAFAIGTQIEASRARGAGDLDEARAVVPATYRLVGVICVPVLVVGWVAAPLLTRVVVGDAADASVASDYLRVTLPGLPFAVLAAVLRAYATALSRTRVVLVAGVLTAGSDVGISVLLSHFLGWRGVAWGTFMGYVVSAAVLVVWRTRLDTGLRPAWWSVSGARPDLRRRLLDLGWPESLLSLFSAASGVVVVLVLADSTPEVLAAARMLDVQLMLTFTVLFSLGAAQLTILGEALGAGRRDVHDAARRRAAPVFAATGLLLFAIGAPWSGPLVGLVAGDSVSDAVGGLGWFAWAPVGWQAACAYYVSTCRSLRDTKAPLTAGLIGEYAVFLPLGLVLCRWWGFDVAGILVCHHALWATFVLVVAWRARRALEREAA